jgi:hypothetical protein
MNITPASESSQTFVDISYSYIHPPRLELYSYINGAYDNLSISFHSTVITYHAHYTLFIDFHLENAHQSSYLH